MKLRCSSTQSLRNRSSQYVKLILVSFIATVAINHLEEVEHVRLAYEQALRLNAASGSMNPFILYLNYAIALYYHKFPEESMEKLLAAEKLAHESSGLLEDEVMPSEEANKGFLNVPISYYSCPA